MRPLSTRTQVALAHSHAMQARATVYSPGCGVLELPISGGSVESDATSKTRLTATLHADPRWWPRSPIGLLGPRRLPHKIDCGIVLPSGDTVSSSAWTSLAIAGTRLPPAEARTILARRQRTALVEPRRTIRPS